MDDHFLRCGELDIHYLQEGSGPPLLLLTGGLASASGWGRLPSILAERFTVFAVDHRGHGRTANPSASLNYPQLAEDAVSFSRQLGLDHPVVLGWSDGGQTGLEMAMRYPNFAAAIIAVGVLYEATPELMAFTREFLCLDEMNRIDPGRLEAERPEFVTTLRESIQTGGAEEWRRTAQQVADLWLSDYGLSPERLSRITIRP